MADAPDELDDVIADLGRGLKLIAEKHDDYREREALYLGTRSEISSSPVVAKLLQKSADNHPLSLAHIPVDSLLDKVELTGITTEDKAAQQWLADIYDINDLEDEADDWHRKAGYFGDYYAIIDPVDEDAQGRAVTPPKVTGSSPYTTVVVYSRKDGRTSLYGVKRWQVGKRWFANVYYDDCTVSLATADRAGDKGAEDATLYQPLLDEDGTEGSERVTHSGGRVLMHHFAIDGRPYGTPVHIKAFGPQDAITKLSATNLATVDAQGFPERWALLDPLAETDDDIDADFGTDGPNTPAAESDGLTTPTSGKSRVRSVPGAIHMLRGVKQTGTYDAATSDNFLKNLDWYVRAMALACGTPIWEFDMNGVQPSGESRRRAAARHNKHADKIKRALGRTHKAIADTLLGLRNLEADVAVGWTPTVTESDKEGIELVTLKIKAGVPITKALEEAGYTPEQVANWYPDGEPHLTPETIGLIATALAQLGNASTLGIITAEEVAAMLPTILTGARGEGPAVGAPEGDDEGDVLRDVVTDVGADLKAKADALGALVRAGAAPEDAARAVGLDGISFPNLPTTVRVPEAEAANLEAK